MSSSPRPDEPETRAISHNVSLLLTVARRGRLLQTAKQSHSFTQHPAGPGIGGLSGIFDQSQRFKPTKPGDAGKMAGRYWVARALL